MNVSEVAPHGTAPLMPALEMREGVLVALILGGVITVALTEGLSLIGGLTRPSLLMAWALIGSALALLGQRFIRFSGPRARPPSAVWPEALMAGWIAVIVTVSFFAGLGTIPVTWDSLTYHLARVAHWAQAQSVAFYQTHIIRQIYQPPWAEYAVLQLYVMTRGDRLAYLVQWIAAVGCLVGVSLVARELGADRRGQVLAALACATIPMGVMQGSSTQNDYVAAFWLVCMAWALMRSVRERGVPFEWIAGASLGLALLTKGTANVFAAPIVALHLLVRFRRSRREAGRLAVILAACTLAIDGMHYARNAALFGAPLGPGGEGAFAYLNQAVSVPIVISNAVRNAAIHLATPWPAVNQSLDEVIEGVHAFVGADVNDPRSTWPGTEFRVPKLVVGEDAIGNGIHMALLLALVPVAVWRSRRLEAGQFAAAHAASLAAAAVLFCALLRWQPWHSRLHLPLFVLAAPLLGVAASWLRRRWTLVVAGLLALTSGPPLAAGFARAVVAPPSFERVITYQWLAYARRVRPDYEEAARTLGSMSCRRIGLFIGGNDPEYLLWRLLPDVERHGRLEHVAVWNASADLPRRPGATPPCAIVAAEEWVSGELILGGTRYRPIGSGKTRVLVPSPGAGM